MTNYHATYAMTIFPTESGKFYAVLLERDNKRTLWESRLCEDAEEAYALGWYEWDGRADQDRKQVEGDEDGEPQTEQQKCQDNGVPWTRWA